MSFDPSSIIKLIAQGGPEVIVVLILFIGLIFNNRIYTKGAVDYRDQQLAYREKIIDEQDIAIRQQQENFKNVIDEQQKLFDQALRTIREDILPLLQASRGPNRRTRGNS